MLAAVVVAAGLTMVIAGTDTREAFLRALRNYALVLFFVPVVVGTGITFWWRSRRRRALRRLARERGWQYTELSRTTPAPDYVPAHTSYATDLVEGSLSGFRVRLFEYTWITGYGRSRRHRETGAGVVLLPVPLPRLEVTPQGSVDTVAERPTGLDVDIDNAEFNRRYRVRLQPGKDEAAARKYAVGVLNPRAVEALLMTSAFAWSIDGRRLAGTWPVTGDTDLLLARLEAMVGVAGHLPSFLADGSR